MTRPWQAGQAFFIPIQLSKTALEAIAHTTQGRADMAAGARDPREFQFAMVVVVTVYDTTAEYFEVHPVCDLSKLALNAGGSARDDEGRDAVWLMYEAIAQAIRAPAGWRGKAPSGSTWEDAILGNGGFGRPYSPIAPETLASAPSPWGDGDLQAARTELGMTQAELASALGMHKDQISRMERGERAITRATFVKVQDLLSTTRAGCAGSRGT